MGRVQRLLLIRHAKAAAFGVEPGDHARPLSEKGRAMAQILGRMLVQAGWTPDRAVVSTALRTRQTWEGLRDALPAAEAVFDKALYQGATAALLGAMSSHGADCKTLALIGHNPGMAQMAHRLVADGFDHDRQALQTLGGHFKTGWAAAFELRDEGPFLAHIFDPREHPSIL